MIKNEKYYLLFCFVLFCSIDTFSKCCVCCGGDGDLEIDFFKYLPVDYHKYDTLEEGYYYIDCTAQNKVYYIPLKDRKLYKVLNTNGAMEEVTDNNILDSCIQDCERIGKGYTGRGCSGIYYNRTFGENVNVCEIIKYLNSSEDGELFGSGYSSNFVNQESIFFDREGTLIVLSDNIVFRITKDNIFFCDDEDYNGPWKEVFSQEKCSKCFRFMPDIAFPGTSSEVVFEFCPRCGNIGENRDSEGKSFSAKVVLDTLYAVTTYYPLCSDVFGFVSRNDFGGLQKKYGEKFGVIRNMMCNSPSISSVLCGKQWYNVLKKKWNL